MAAKETQETATLSIKVPQETKLAVRVAAAKEDKSISTYLRETLENCEGFDFDLSL